MAVNPRTSWPVVKLILAANPSWRKTEARALVAEIEERDAYKLSGLQLKAAMWDTQSRADASKLLHDLLGTEGLKMLADVAASARFATGREPKEEAADKPKRRKRTA